MKKTTAINIIVFGFVALLCISCGDDVAEPSVQQPASEQSNVRVPTIEESSVSYDASMQIVTFKASCPIGTRVMLLLRQLTNGSDEKLLSYSYYDTGSKEYRVKLANLVGGSTYAYCIVGYDSNGADAVRTAERTFTHPKNAAPAAPSMVGVKAFPPTSRDVADGYIQGVVITKAMEYSTDDGRTWTPVSKAGIIENLQSGNVLLRLAATSTTEASESATITVPPYKNNTDIDGTDGTSEGLQVRRRW